MMNIATQVTQAHRRIEKYLKPTPLKYAHALSKMISANVYLKLENIQPTSSFKVRGAFNKLLSLTAEERHQGIIAASTGNHGAAVAYGCNQLNIPCIIYIPKTASSVKVDNIKNYGAEVRFFGEECGATEQYARQYAKEHHQVYISPYNDIDVISGQGTIGYELLQQLDSIDTIFAPVGGGGLIAGIAGYVKSLHKKIQVIGCLPENSPVMMECIAANKIIEMVTKPTLSDATAGNMDLDSITFPLCQKYVDDYILASEEEIKSALRLSIEKEHLLVEGSVGVAIAALLKANQPIKNKNLIIIISGANISLDTLKKIIC